LNTRKAGKEKQKPLLRKIKNSTKRQPSLDTTHSSARQSGSGDGAFGRTRNKLDAKDFRACKSGVALRLPRKSKTTSA